MNDAVEFEKLLADYKAILFAKQHLLKTQKRIVAEKRRLVALEHTVEKEYKDVQDFEKISIQAVFKKVLGRYQEKYEQEKLEYLHAVMQYKECKKLIELLVFESKVMQEKVLKEGIAERELKEYILKHNHSIAQNYPGLAQSFLDLNAHLKEIVSEKEALHLCKTTSLKVQDMIQRMIDLLNQAKHSGSWGNNGSSRNTIAEMKQLKNSFMDQAQNLSYKVKQTLNELEDDLNQLSIRNKVFLKEFQALDSFSNVYYNKLISDWIVHSKIVNSIDYLFKVFENLASLIKSLDLKINSFDQKITEIKQQKKKLISEL